MSKFKIPVIETLSEDAHALYDVLNGESDLACVLIGTSYLDWTLASLLERHFIKSNTALNLLNPLGGALGTFASRADLCYCLGLISKGFYQNLTRVSEIRNKFAHRHLLLSFADNEIMELVSSLTFPRVESKIVDEEGKEHNDPEPFSRLTQPRNKFNFVLALMVSLLTITNLEAERRSRRSDVWG